MFLFPLLDNHLRRTALAPNQPNGVYESHFQQTCRLTLGCPWHCMGNMVQHVCWFGHMGRRVGAIVPRAMEATSDEHVRDPRPECTDAHTQTSPVGVDFVTIRPRGGVVQYSESTDRSLVQSPCPTSMEQNSGNRPTSAKEHDAWVASVMSRAPSDAPRHTFRRRRHHRSSRRAVQRQFADVLGSCRPWPVSGEAETESDD